MRERTTKKQQELLQYISAFLGEHNYAPSYREVMVALGYKSVSTVAVHVDALITKGYLIKTEKSARSIRTATEVTGDPGHLAWLRTEITRRETGGADEQELETLRQAAAILEK
jgi:SOS-response transcriptional repressor LexA